MSYLLKWLAPLVLAFTLTLGSFAAEASPSTPTLVIEGLQIHPSDRGTPRPWVKIAGDPFQGDHRKGGEVLSKHTAIRISDVMEASSMRRRGECVSYHLRNGDELRTTFGRDKSAAVKVNFASPAGHAERRGDVCVVRPDGTAVVFLDGCGNVSVAQATVRRPEPPPVLTPVAGVCGSNAARFAHDAIGWRPGGKFCAEGEQSTPNILFPVEGSNSLWSCVGLNGGLPAACQATRDPAPAPVPTASRKRGMEVQVVPTRQTIVPTLTVPVCKGTVSVGGTSGHFGTRIIDTQSSED